MLLKNKLDETADLTIHKHESVGENRPEEHFDWLRIYLKVRSNLGHWEVIDPCLTVFEWRELAKWFQQLGQNQTDETYMGFTEPNLVFELLNQDTNHKQIQLRFNAECRPKSRKHDKYFINFDWSNAELEEIGDGLSKELDNFLA